METALGGRPDTLGIILASAAASFACVQFAFGAQALSHGRAGTFRLVPLGKGRKTSTTMLGKSVVGIAATRRCLIQEGTFALVIHSGTSGGTSINRLIPRGEEAIGTFAKTVEAERPFHSSTFFQQDLVLSVLVKVIKIKLIPVRVVAV